MSEFRHWLIAAAVVAAPAIQATYSLDLVTSPPPEQLHDVPTGDRLAIPSGLVQAPGEKPQVPVRITVESIAPNVIQPGTKVVFEVTVRNEGGTPIRFPWSARHDRFRRDMNGWMIAAISLVIPGKPPALREIPAVTRVLYGAEAVEDSLITLRPGQSASIRTSGAWMTDDAVASRMTPDWTLPVGATLMLYSQNSPTYAVHSRAPVTVSISR